MKRKIFGLGMVFLLLVIGNVFSQSSRRYNLNDFYINGNSADNDIRYVDVSGHGSSTMRFIPTYINGQTSSIVLEGGVRLPRSGGNPPYGTYHYRVTQMHGERIQEQVVARVTNGPNSLELHLYEGNYTQNSNMAGIRALMVWGMTPRR